MTKHLPLPLLRIMSVLLLFAFASAFYLEWHLSLSAESQKYQSDYPDAIRSGLSFLYLLSKVSWVIGSLSGIAGVVIIFVSKRGGLIPLALSAPLIALGAYLQAPQANYPSVEPMLDLLLWCLSSALWASVVMLAWQRELHPAS